MSLHDLSSLANVRALDTINSADTGGLFIGGNTMLESLEGLQQVQSAADVLITGNPVLASLDGLRGLEHVGRNLTIQENPLIEDLSGLDNLAEVDARVFVRRSETLRSLHGLERLRTVLELSIVDNPVLDGLDGLDGLESVRGDVTLGSTSGSDNLCWAHLLHDFR